MEKSLSIRAFDNDYNFRLKNNQTSFVEFLIWS